MLVAAPMVSAGSVDKGASEYLNGVLYFIDSKYNGAVNNRQLMENTVKGMFNSLDAYTEFYTVEEAEDFFSTYDGKYEGVGITLSKSGDYVSVIKVFQYSPAEKAGILAGDKIIAVDQKKVIGFAVEEVVKLIRGESGTMVKLTLLRSNSIAPQEISVVRSAIKINPVRYDIRDDIGYLAIDVFNHNTAEFVSVALAEMDLQGIKKIVLDLRDNGGGAVDQAVSVAQFLVPAGVITKLDFSDPDTQDITYTSRLKQLKYEVVVLVNGDTASSSEILAGAIQDTQSGVLVGTKTYGKARVQNIIPILNSSAFAKYKKQYNISSVDANDLIRKHGIEPNDDELLGWAKITTGYYFTPSGRNIDLQGLNPDIAVPDPQPVNDIKVNYIDKLTLTVKPELNSEGTDVLNTERILRASGYEVDSPDLILDSKTAAAISRFQQDKGLYPYGVLDFTTQKALNAKLRELQIKFDPQYAAAVQELNKRVTH